MKIKSFANSTIVYRGRGKKLVITPLSIVEVDEATFPVTSLMGTYGKWLVVVKDTPKAQPKVEEVKVEEPAEVVAEPTVEPQPVVEEVPETEECKECVVPEVKEEELAVVEETKEEEPKAKKATKSKSKKK